MRGEPEAHLRGGTSRGRQDRVSSVGVPAARQLPLGVQQHGGDGRRATSALQGLDTSHAERPHLQARLGNGLRERALLGQQYRGTTEECLHISHHSCGYIFFLHRSNECDRVGVFFKNDHINNSFFYIH